MRDWSAGPLNAITDVAGLRVGGAKDAVIKTGVTVLTADVPFVASIDIRGGATGTVETALLDPTATVARVDALVLSGGSVHGLEAAGGVVRELRALGRGFPVAPKLNMPIVPGAILFDLMNGGDKDWGDENPYGPLGRRALLDAFDGNGGVAIGSEGAGTGATTARVKGGLGTASTVLSDGTTVGALVAVNPVGCVLADGGPHFLAAPLEREGEFGGLGVHDGSPGWAVKGATNADDGAMRHTTIGIVATDAPLTKSGCQRLAIAGQAGIAKAIWPVHTALDGDLVFGVSTGDGLAEAEPHETIALFAAATECMARAVARGVHAAVPEPGDTLPTWSALFPGNAGRSTDAA